MENKVGDDDDNDDVVYSCLAVHRVFLLYFFVFLLAPLISN